MRDCNRSRLTPSCYCTIFFWPNDCLCSTNLYSADPLVISIVLYYILLILSLPYGTLQTFYGPLAISMVLYFIQLAPWLHRGTVLSSTGRMALYYLLMAPRSPILLDCLLLAPWFLYDTTACPDSYHNHPGNLLHVLIATTTTHVIFPMSW